jgi:DMSO reductase family type II enzyme molybdopterin subunit
MAVRSTGRRSPNPSLTLNRLTPTKGAAVLEERPEAGEPFYRTWEDVYRQQWRWDRVVKGTCNRADCIAACSLDLYVKDGVVWREEQNAVYEQTNASLPDFNPRGCQKGMCYSDLMYEPSRVKYPMKRIGERGSGRWQRISWKEALTEISDKIIDVCMEDGPEAIVYDMGTTNLDFGPGSPAEFQLMQLVGTVRLDEWASVGDLPMGAIQTWGLFNADGTSDDWFNSDYIVVWLGNPVYTRVPDVHYMCEARCNGAKVVVVAPDYNATCVHSDLWVNPHVGTDAALALAMAQVVVAEDLHKPNYIKEQTDLPILVRDDTRRMLRQKDLQEGGKDDIFYFWDLKQGRLVEAPGSWGHPETTIRLDGVDPALEGNFRVKLADGCEVTVRPVFEHVKARLQDYTPEKASAITGVSPRVIERMAREFAGARAAMIFGSWGSCKHYHMDLVQRSMILLLALCGHTGKPGGGLRIGAWWGINLGYDREALAAFALPEVRPKVVEIEKAMRGIIAGMSTSTPTMVWLYAFDDGYRRVVNEDRYHDPTLKRPVAEYIQEALDKGWMPVWPKNGKRPRVYLYTGMNPLRRWPVPHLIRDNLWANMELIVTWEFRMSTSAMHCDIVLPAAGWHEKEGIKFTQSLVPYVCVGNKAVEPLFESKGEWDIMARLARTLQERAKDREVGKYVDALGIEHDLSRLHDNWSLGGKFTEGDAPKALDVQLDTSEPTKGMNWEEAAQIGAIRVRNPGPYGPITAVCSDMKPDEALHPFDWFVIDKEPWPTLTGRQQFYIDHDWYLEMGEEMPLHKDPPKAGGDYPLWLTGGHTRWSIHAIWRANRLMLRLQRGEPVAYINAEDARRRGIKEHDLVWVYNDVGGFKVHAKIAPSVQPGQVVVYHAWEPYQHEGWMGSQTVVPSPLKPLHFVGDWYHFTYRPILAQPSHISRAMAIEMEKVEGRAPKT